MANTTLIYRFAGFLVLGMLMLAGGCNSMNRSAKVFHPWGWENVADAKSHLNAYKNVLIVSVGESHWEDRGSTNLAPHHFKATVVRTFKGEWKVSEQIAFVHYVDFPLPSNKSNSTNDSLMFVLTNEHTNSEIALEAGEFGRYNAEYAPALESIFSQAKGP